MRQIGHVELTGDLLHLLRFVVTTFISTKNVAGQPLHLMMNKKIEMKPKNWVRIETPTQVPHLPDLSWPTAQDLTNDMGNLCLVFLKLQFIKNKLI